MSKLSLGWNKFEESLANSLSSLRNEEHLFDVTFVTDDEELVKAHKLVLSACSTFFQKLFKKSPGSQHQDSLIYSYGINSKNLNSIIEYIYNGKVEIREDEVDSFIFIAQKLKIKGLMTDVETKQEKTIVTPDKINDLWEDNSNSVEYFEQSENIVKSDIVKIKNESKPKLPQDNISKQIKNTSIYKSLNSSEAKDFSLGQAFRYKTLNEMIMKNKDNTWGCMQCGKIYNNISAIHSHAEFHIEGLTYECGMCLKKFKTSSSLSGHFAKCSNPKKFKLL